MKDKRETSTSFQTFISSENKTSPQKNFSSIHAIPKSTSPLPSVCSGILIIGISVADHFDLWSTPLVTIQKRSSFGIRFDSGLLSSEEANLPAICSWNGNAKTGDEESRHDCKGEDPLQGGGLQVELSNTKRRREDGESEADSIVLERNEEEAT